tara:strand:+ start:2567 stop:3721 length:1155 start_codon:yes stop_codon:yes gene_type:complete
MKNITYLYAIVVSFLFVGCNPLEDTYSELNLESPSVKGDVTLTLSDDDYADLDKNYGNFNSSDEAKELIPEFLKSKYPALGAGSLAFVTFNIYNPKDTEDFLYRYSVTTEDYDANPDTAQYDNFDDEGQVYDFLNTKYPTPNDGDLVSLTYKFYDGSAKTLNNGFFYTNGNWEFIQGFTDEEYATMGESYPNFSSEDEAEVKIPIFLEEKFKYETKVAGDLEAIMYKLYATDIYDVDGDGRVDDNTTVSLISYFIYDGSSWSAYNNEITETIQFANDGSLWVPDNTIKYTLASADYVLISETLASKYETPASSAGNYSNFDRRPGNAAEWTDAMLAEAFTVILNQINPSAAEGQKYVVTFDIYNGSNGTEDLALIKVGDAYVLQ